MHCGKCFAYKSGAIAKNSRELKINLGEFSNYAQRFVNSLDNPIFKKYPDFKEMLDYFAGAECSGCILSFKTDPGRHLRNEKDGELLEKSTKDLSLKLE